MSIRVTRFLTPFALAFAVMAALLYTPAAANAGCELKCAECAINPLTGIAECTDCTFTCTPDGDTAE